MSTNILCANPSCRHWFNYTEVLGTLDDLHRIEPTKDERQSAANKRRADQRAAKQARYEEGRQAFAQGRSAETLRTDGSYGGYAEASDNIDRLVGFIDALKEHHS